MTVQLILPTTSSGGEWRGQLPIITSARRYARGSGNSRWHRLRSGVQWPPNAWRPDGWVSLQYWCGQTCGDGPGVDRLQYVDLLPVDEPVCGTCEGRALGAGQDKSPAGLPPLRFDPRWQTPPTRCPGSRSRTLWDPLPNGGHNVGRCLVCGDITAIRVVGRGYDAWGAGPPSHAPGGGLVEGCPFHAWNRITRRNDKAVCACGWPGGAA